MAVLKIGGMFVLALSVAGLMPVRAHADLIGSKLGWQHYEGGGPYSPGTPGSETNGSFTDTGGGIGGTFIEPTDDGFLPVFNIEADDTTITFDYSVDELPGPWSSSPLSLTPTLFDGIAINMLSKASFADVSIDPATDMVGFGASNLSFTATQIQIDWTNLAFTTSTIVVLDVNDAPDPSAAPEPGTRGLMLLSLLGVVFARRGWAKLN
jgi:hypothetical protein